MGVFVGLSLGFFAGIFVGFSSSRGLTLSLVHKYS